MDFVSAVQMAACVVSDIDGQPIEIGLVKV
jgi:hypothetical protein